MLFCCCFYGDFGELPLPRSLPNATTTMMITVNTATTQTPTMPITTGRLHLWNVKLISAKVNHKQYLKHSLIHGNVLTSFRMHMLMRKKRKDRCHGFNIGPRRIKDVITMAPEARFGFYMYLLSKLIQDNELDDSRNKSSLCYLW